MPFASEGSSHLITFSPSGVAPCIAAPAGFHSSTLAFGPPGKEPDADDFSRFSGALRRTR